MSFQAYLVSQYEHTHENLFFREIVRILEGSLKDAQGEHILIGNITVEGHPLDAIFIKRGLITVIDFKDYGGVLTFSENNAWRIVTEENKMSFVKGGSRFLNPFQQVKAYRFALTEYLDTRKNNILEKNHTNVNWNFIGGIVLFHAPVKFDKKAIPGSIKRYFHIHSPETLVAFIKDSYTEETAFSDVEIHRILSELNVGNENIYSSDFIIKDEGPKPNIKIPQSRLKLLTSVLEGTANDPEIKKVVKFYRTLVKLESHLDSNISEETSYVASFDNEDGLEIDITSVESFYKKYLLNGQQNFPKNIFVGVKILMSGNKLPLFYTIVFKHEIKDAEALKVNYADLELNRKILDILGLEESVIDELSSKLNQKETLQQKVDVLNDYLGGLSLVTDSASVGFSNENLFTSQVLSELKRFIDVEDKIENHNLFKNFLLNKSVEELPDRFEFNPLVQVTDLNPSQRKAVEISFRNPITVVTGPPGTGKTQVVLNIIANAIINNKTILFASKNNKAVDNVIERFYSLCDDDYLLRFGSKRDVSENTKGVIESMLNNKTNNNYQDISVILETKKEEVITKQNLLLEIKAKLALIPKYRSDLENLKQASDEKAKISSLVAKANGFSADLIEQINRLPESVILFNEEFVLNSLKDSEFKSDLSISKVITGLIDINSKIGHANKQNQLLVDNHKNAQNESIEWIETMNPDFRHLFIENTTIFKIDSNEVARWINKIQSAKKGAFQNMVFKLVIKKGMLNRIKDLNSGLPGLAKDLLTNTAPYIQPGADIRDSFNNNLSLVYSLANESLSIPRERKNKEDKINTANNAIINNRNNILVVVSNFIVTLEGIKQALSLTLEELRNKQLSLQMALQEILQNEADLKNKYEANKKELPILGTKLLSLAVKNKLYKIQPDRVQRYLNFIPAQVWKHEEVQEFDISSQEFIEDFTAISVTSLSVKNGFSLSPKLFDILVIDEASQCDVASALPLLFRAKKVVVIGDSMQLKHITAVQEYEEKYLAELLKIEHLGLSYVSSSLFDFCKNLAHQSKYDTVFLNEHYRCHPEIIRFSDYHFYKKRLGQELNIKTTTEQFKLLPAGLYWLHVNGAMTNGFNANEQEAGKCIDLARQLVSTHPNASIGIVTPFRNQYERIFELMDNNLREKVKVDTVHKYQGDEKDIIILSLVLTEGCRDSLAGFINRGAPYLLNVAITRARNTLYIVGNADYCNRLMTNNNSKTLLKHLVEHADSLKKIVR